MLDSSILRFVVDGSDYEPSVDKIISIIKPLLPELERNGVVLALENHDRLLTTEFVEIIQQLDSKWVGICLDTVNSMGAAEGLETVIERLAPLTVNLHVKEFTVRRIYHMMGFEIEGLPLGEGMLPIEVVLKHLSPRCQTAILEQWTPPIANNLSATIQRENEWATRSINYLKNKI